MASECTCDVGGATEPATEALTELLRPAGRDLRRGGCRGWRRLAGSGARLRGRSVPGAFLLQIPAAASLRLRLAPPPEQTAEHALLGPLLGYCSALNFSVFPGQTRIRKMPPMRSHHSISKHSMCGAA